MGNVYREFVRTYRQLLQEVTVPLVEPYYVPFSVFIWCCRGITLPKFNSLLKSACKHVEDTGSLVILFCINFGRFLIIFGQLFELILMYKGLLLGLL